MIPAMDRGHCDATNLGFALTTAEVPGVWHLSQAPGRESVRRLHALSGWEA